MNLSSTPTSDAVPAPPCLGPANDAQWLAEEVQPHETAVRGYLRSRFPKVETDDIVQESYLKLLKARTTCSIRSVKAFFFQVARNTAINAFRRSQFYAETPVNELPDSLVLDGGADAAATANARLQRELVARAISELPARCRRIVALVAVEGRTYPEVAQALGISESTVRVQVARGVHRIADYLRERGER